MDEFMSKPLLLLDGGLSNELNHRVSFDVHAEPLWTAKALQSDPQALTASHLAYLKAGADIITTGSYQATLEGLKEFLGCDEEASKALVADSVRLAKDAVILYQQEHGEKQSRKWIAGSVGPYGVYLRDGSEYTGTYMSKVSEKDIASMHLPRIGALIEGGCDILAIETIPALKEVEVMLDLLKDNFPSTKAWVSVSIKEGDPTHTAYGDPMEQVVHRVSEYFPQVVAFGINCCKPSDIAPFLRHIQEIIAAKENEDPHAADCMKKLKIIVYPNSGQEWIRGKGWIEGHVPFLSQSIDEWTALGANIIGGCCQVGSEQISKMRPEMDSVMLKLTKVD